MHHYDERIVFLGVLCCRTVESSFWEFGLLGSYPSLPAIVSY
jgi:hypothetical protein